MWGLSEKGMVLAHYKGFTGVTCLSLSCLLC